MRKLLYIFLCIITVLTGCQPKKNMDSFHGKKQDKYTYNLLIIGSDSRGEQHGRADTIMIAQYNKKEHTAKLASIMRDSYVEIPTYDKKYNKINAAYYYGGPELLRKTIHHNFGIDTSHYVTIDFQAFVNIVDTIAPEGIKVHVTQSIIDDMKLSVAPGMQALHGKELLKYARFRHDKESDFGRVRRQQEVLQAVKRTFTRKIHSLGGMLDIPAMAQKIAPDIQTNLDLQTLFAIRNSLLSTPKIETMRVPLENEYNHAFIEHAGSILQIHPEKNKEALQRFFNVTRAVNNS
ncbi:LCP family protein [Bacillus cytotoxicus]|uniref:LCP family protein n=2 Tax=Bacillus cytotoxicus TaxID=580165 RepID=UPI0008642B96|nr:LCP family protein [Bacillus cytotoxicus]AWC27635.1 LytR family transcriptional regulator [Bacillus cytotoxicus]AWC40990.1 LytR family transcriptional regulator [Bacillus cytotoxicus]AWC48921.1 LytR family transcriptional regulator [Bacillus cytotoxicus]AWC51701.1 LytR family transcriptional regulator [Bacillus cytotoxicus]AWC55829.1 LytR family transcriptional regulator [Bacillus cytotoxicus]